MTFEHGTLRRSVFRKVDLSNVKLIDCNIKGMTIDGILISNLLDTFRRRQRRKMNETDRIKTDGDK